MAVIYADVITVCGVCFYEAPKAGRMCEICESSLLSFSLTMNREEAKHRHEQYLSTHGIIPVEPKNKHIESQSTIDNRQASISMDDVFYEDSVFGIRYNCWAVIITAFILFLINF